MASMAPTNCVTARHPMDVSTRIRKVRLGPASNVSWSSSRTQNGGWSSSADPPGSSGAATSRSGRVPGGGDSTETTTRSCGPSFSRRYSTPAGTKNAVPGASSMEAEPTSAVPSPDTTYMTSSLVRLWRSGGPARLEPEHPLDEVLRAERGVDHHPDPAVRPGQGLLGPFLLVHDRTGGRISAHYRPGTGGASPGPGRCRRCPGPRQTISAMGWPASTTSPGETWMALTDPARGADTRVSIFMASSTATGSPASTSCPSDTSTWRMVPCIGEVTTPFAEPPPALRAVACGADADIPGFHRRTGRPPTSNTGSSPADPSPTEPASEPAPAPASAPAAPALAPAPPAPAAPALAPAPRAPAPAPFLGAARASSAPDSRVRVV